MKNILRIPYGFPVCLFIGITCLLANCQHANRVTTEEITNRIALADSLKNSKPDSAITTYNQVIAKISQGRLSKRDSIQLALAYTGIADTYSMRGDTKQAIFYDSISLNIGLECNDEEILSKAFLFMGIINFRKSDYKNAMDFYEKAMNYATKSKDSTTIAKILSNEAMILFNTGTQNEAINNFRKAVQIGKKIKNESLIANNYLNLAIAYTHKNENDSVVSYITRALEHFRKSNDKTGELSCYKSLGNFYYESSDYNNAISNFQMSLNLAIEAGDLPATAKGYHNLADVYFFIGDIDNATGLLDKSIKIKEKLGDKVSLAKGYILVGNLHLTRDDYTEALVYYQKALNIFQEKNLVSELGLAYSNVANAYSSLHKSDSAMFYYEKAVEFHNKVGYLPGVSNSYINIGDEYRLRHDFDQAEKYFFKALDTKKSIGDESGIAETYHHLANLYLDQSKFVSGDIRLSKLRLAEKAELQSYQISKQLELKPLRQEVCNTLSKICEKLGKYPEALFYANEDNTLSKSILDKSKIEALTFAEARWNVQRKQEEIDNLEKVRKLNLEIIEQKSNENQMQWLIIGISGVVLVLAVVVILIISLYVKKKREALYQRQVANNISLRMKNVQNSLSPHFFFNVLASLTGLSSQPEQLKIKLRSLSILLRKVIENIEQTAIPLASELEVVKAYIDLYKEQIPEPFCVEYLIDEEAIFQVFVPAMVLQIPVENAIKHGLMPLDGEKRLSISVNKIGGFQQITISDNGIGLKASAGRSTGTGTGLKVLMQTIHLLNAKNSEKIEFQLLEQSEIIPDSSGTTVKIKIPTNFNYTI